MSQQAIVYVQYWNLRLEGYGPTEALVAVAQEHDLSLFEANHLVLMSDAAHPLQQTSVHYTSKGSHPGSGCPGPGQCELYSG